MHTALKEISTAIRDADTALSRNQILAKLPTKVMRQALNAALDRLEKRGRILETRNGFVWTFNLNRKLPARKKSDWKFSCRFFLQFFPKPQ